MATGYIFTKTGNNSTKVVHVTNGVVDLGRTKVFKGPVLIEENDSSLISIKEGGGNAMSLNIGAILTIDGAGPAGTMEGIIDQLDAVFPDATSTTGGTGGSLPSTTGKAGYPLVVTADANGYELRKPLEVDLRDYDVDPTFNNGSGSEIQRAINELHTAGGGGIVVAYGRYAIDNALTTSVSGSTTSVNAQLVMPLTAISDTAPIIKIRGAAPPAFYSEGTSGAGRNKVGVIFESTILGSGTEPAVIGAPSISYYGSPFNYMALHLENLIVRTRTMTGATNISSSMCAIDARKMINFVGKNIKVDISSELFSSVAPSGCIGIAMPAVNNKGMCNLEDSIIEGYTDGLRISEHFNSRGELVIFGCENGLVVNSGYHASTIQHLTAEVNINNIVLNGTLGGGLIITNYETEHDTGGKWYDFATDVKQVSGSTRLVIMNSSIVEGGVGQVDDFVPIGSPNYRVFNGAGENVLYGVGAGGGYTKVFTNLSGINSYTINGSDASISSHNGGNKLHLLSTTASGYIYKDNVFTPGANITVVVEVDDIISGTPKLLLGDTGTPDYGPQALIVGTNTFSGIDTTGWAGGGFILSAPLNSNTEAYITSITITVN